MSLAYPLGLLGLIAVPVLIIIYIIKNKYTEQLVTSTYLWTLSEKFLKRKNPISKIAGIISLILQILAVIAISFAIAHPVFALPGKAKDYCFVLDGAGSMNISRGSKTRFDIGKDEIKSIISGSVEGSAFTLIFAGNTTDVVFQDLEDKDRALSLLNDITPAYISSGFADAIGPAQKIFDANPSVLNYLITDKSYSESSNVEIINVSAGENNYALSEVEYTVGSGKLTGKAFTYESDASVTVNLYKNGGGEIADAVKLDLKKLEGKEFSFDIGDANFSSLTVEIEEKDALALDNKVVIFNDYTDPSFRTLIVSETPFFIEGALTALGAGKPDKIKPSDPDYSQSGLSGYNLYVFEGRAPDKVPTDGAVWYINPDKSTENSGFTVQGDPVQTLGTLEFSKSTKTEVKKILAGTENVQGNDIFITKYSKCGPYRKYTTALSYDNSPMIFTLTNAYGNKQVVFAFDFHSSDFTVSASYPILMSNLLNYTFPDIVDRSSYYCGETAVINVLANCDSIRVDTPLGGIEYLETGSDICEYDLKEVGVYKITMMIANSPRSVNIYSAMPEEERFTAVSDASFVINGTAQSGGRDGRYDDLIALFIILAVIFIADWTVYCYEQYQLR